jgi:hypothetical protein
MSPVKYTSAQARTENPKNKKSANAHNSTSFKIQNSTKQELKKTEYTNILKFRIRPNIATDLRLSQTTILRQPKPYKRQCVDKYPEKYYFIEKFYNYSEAYCQLICKSSIVYDTCGCWEPCFVSPRVRIIKI